MDREEATEFVMPSEPLQRVSDAVAEAWSSRPDLATTLEVFDALLLSRVLREIRSSPGALSQILDRSYAHANGYFKIVLLNRSAEMPVTLRLNVWMSDSSPSEASESDIHNHRWDYASLILCGNFAQELFAAQRGDLRVRRHGYFPSQYPEPYHLKELEELTLSMIDRRVLRAGDRYAMKWASIHRFVPIESGLHASLMLQGPAQRTGSDVFLPVRVRRSDRSYPAGITVEQLTVTLQAVENSLLVGPTT